MRPALPEELCHPGIRSHRLDEQHVPGNDAHEFRGVPLGAPFHKDVPRLFVALRQSPNIRCGYIISAKSVTCLFY